MPLSPAPAPRDIMDCPEPIVTGLENVPDGVAGPAFAVINLRNGVTLHLNDEGICVWLTPESVITNGRPSQCLLFEPSNED